MSLETATINQHKPWHERTSHSVKRTIRLVLAWIGAIAVILLSIGVVVWGILEFPRLMLAALVITVCYLFIEWICTDDLPEGEEHDLSRDS